MSAIFSRAELEEARRALAQVDESLAAAVARVLEGTPVPKPPRHAVDALHDYFIVRLDPTELQGIAEAFGALEAGAVAPSGEATALACRDGQLLDRWYACAYPDEASRDR